MRFVYMLKFGRISVNFQFWRSRTPIPAPMGVKFGTEEWTVKLGVQTSSFTPSVQRVALAEQKTSKSPQSNLNTVTLRCAQYCR